MGRISMTKILFSITVLASGVLSNFYGIDEMYSPFSPLQNIASLNNVIDDIIAQDGAGGSDFWDFWNDVDEYPTTYSKRSRTPIYDQGVMYEKRDFDFSLPALLDLVEKKGIN